MSTKTLTNLKFTSVIVIEEPPLNKVNWPFQKEKNSTSILWQDFSMKKAPQLS